MARTITVTFDDGTSHIYQGAPDNVTPDAIAARAQKDFGKSVTALDGGKGAEKPQGAAQTLKNFGGGLVRGAGSIGATILAPVDVASDLMAGRGLSLQSNRERRAAMDDALGSLGADTESTAYTVGKIGGEIAGTAGAGGAVAQGLRAAAPGLASGARAANLIRAIETSGASGGNLATRSAGGAVSGATQAAIVDPETVGVGALVGGAAPGVMGLAGRAGAGVANLVRAAPNQNALATKAVNQYGIPLGVADISGNALTKATRSVLNDVPVIGSIGAGQREGVQTGFNRAVGSTFGAADDKLTPAVMDKAKKTLGAEFDRIWGGNSLQVDSTLMQKLGDLQTAARKLPRNEGGSLEAEIQDILSKVQTDANGAPVIAGDVANKFQSYLRRRAEGSAGLRNELGDMRQAIISAFNRSVSPADAAALTANRGAYKAFKTVEPLLNSAEAGVAGRVAGDVPAGLLPGAVLKSYGNAAGTELGDLAQIGSQFVADRVARTGGSARALVQNSFLGGALGAGAFSNPLLAATMAPTAAGLNWLLGNPALARQVLASQGQSFNALSAPVYRSAPVLIAGDQ